MCRIEHRSFLVCGHTLKTPEPFAGDHKYSDQCAKIASTLCDFNNEISEVRSCIREYCLDATDQPTYIFLLRKIKDKYPSFWGRKSGSHGLTYLALRNIEEHLTGQYERYGQSRLLPTEWVDDVCFDNCYEGVRDKKKRAREEEEERRKQQDENRRGLERRHRDTTMGLKYPGTNMFEGNGRGMGGM